MTRGWKTAIGAILGLAAGAVGGRLVAGKEHALLGLGVGAGVGGAAGAGIGYAIGTPAKQTDTSLLVQNLSPQ